MTERIQQGGRKQTHSTFTNVFKDTATRLRQCQGNIHNSITTPFNFRSLPLSKHHTLGKPVQTNIKFATIHEGPIQ